MLIISIVFFVALGVFISAQKDDENMREYSRVIVSMAITYIYIYFISVRMLKTTQKKYLLLFPIIIGSGLGLLSYFFFYPIGSIIILCFIYLIGLWMVRSTQRSTQRSMRPDNMRNFYEDSAIRVNVPSKY